MSAADEIRAVKEQAIRDGLEFHAIAAHPGIMRQLREGRATVKDSVGKKHEISELDTFSGHPWIEDSNLPSGTFELRDKHGATVSRWSLEEK